MKNLPLVRKLRGQSRAQLRAELRKTKAELTRLQEKTAGQAWEIHTLLQRLDRASRRPIPLPEGFSDVILDKLATNLARALAEKVCNENPDLGVFAHRASTIYADCFRNGMHMEMLRGEIRYLFEEMSESGRERREPFKLSLSLRDVRINYADDLMRVSLMRYPTRGSDVAPDIVYHAPPAPIEVTNSDLSASRALSC